MEHTRTNKLWQGIIIPFIVAYAGSKLIFHFVGFQYDVFSDPINPYKLLIDFGVFVSIFAITSWAATRILRKYGNR